MHIGIQLVAPDGCDCMAKDRVYHFVRNDQKRVLLVDFGQVEYGDAETQTKPAKPMAKLHIMNAARFEGALVRGEVRAVPDQIQLPPWLSGIQGKNIEMIDLRRMERNLRAQDPDSPDQEEDGEGEGAKPRVHSLVERVDRRELILQDALDHSVEILAAHDPCLELNRYARNAIPQQNETRFRLQFWVKLCFPRSRWALLCPFFRIGHWDRASKEHKERKFGRPAKRLGRLYGSAGSDPDFIKKIEDSYWRHQRAGRSLRAIYRDAVRKDFGCLSQPLPEGKGSYFFHPQGDPFPTLNQFSYRCNHLIGKDQIRKNAWGDVRHRNKSAASKGHYSEALANLMERIGIDVVKNLAIPVGLDTSVELPPLNSAEMACLASGMIVGVGLGLGSEDNILYRNAMFCAAIEKSTFGRLIGMEISHDEWPCHGLPTNYLSDRGPGAKTWGDRGSDSEPAIRGLAPSYTPQSNATAESVHAKQTRVDGPPTRLVSRLNPVEMTRQIVRRIICQNKTRDVSERMTPEMFAEGVEPTPIGVWNFLEKRGRTVAEPMAFDDAVRSFLEPVEFTMGDGCVKLHGTTYRSPELYEWLEQKSGVLSGFAMELAVRYVWVDVGDRLIEVEAQLPLRDDEEQLYLTLTEIKQLEELRRAAKNDLGWSREATTVYYLNACEKDTGETWEGYRRKSGRAKPRSGAAKEGAKAFMFPSA